VRVPPLRGGPGLRWAVLAPGTIAGDFVATVRRNTGQRVTADASRSVERGRRFADAHAIDRVHASDDALVAEVDVVCVAAPHSEHAKLGLLATATGNLDPFAPRRARAIRHRAPGSRDDQ
jgi:predicted dehydrogenase